MDSTSVRPRRMLASAAAGACAGSAFGLVETGVPLVLAWLRPAHSVISSSSLDLAVATAVGFPVAGAIAGAVTAAFTATSSRAAGTTAGIAMFLALSLIAQVIGDGSARGRALMASVTLAVGAWVAWRSRRTTRTACDVLGSPWSAAVLVAGGGRVVLEALMLADRREAAAGAAVVATCVVVGAVIAARRARRARPEADARPRVTSQVVAHVAAWALVLASTSVLSSGVVDAPVRTLAASSVPRPTVIVIVLDTVRADHTSVHGYDRQTTPTLEALAHTAVTYASAVSAGNTTITAHGALFTGRYASYHGAVPVAQPLLPDMPTLATYLAAAGYRTVGIAANAAFLNPSLGFTRGFDHFDYRVPGFRDGPRLVMTARDLIPAWFARGSAARADRPYYRRADDVTARAIAQAQRTPAGVPLFLFANYMDAHDPYAPPDAFAARFDRGHRRIGTAEYRDLSREVAAGRRRLAPSEREALVDAYDAGIAFADAEIGRLFDALRALSRFDDALIVVIGDHGEAFGEHGVMNHGRTLYDHQVHVPLVIKYPRQVRARVVKTPVSTTDILPTTLATVGIANRAAVDGRVLAADGTVEAATVYAEGFGAGGLVERGAVGKDGAKVILSPTRALGFDRRRDAAERDGVDATRDARFASLLGDLRAAFSAARARPGVAVPDDVRERLRAWGYAQ